MLNIQPVVCVRSLHKGALHWSSRSAGFWGPRPRGRQHPEGLTRFELERKEATRIPRSVDQKGPVSEGGTSSFVNQII